jgi:hypothetical protein
MTTQPSDWAVAPKFGEWLRGIYASERNPLRDGMYVRTIRRSGRCNPGTFYELTDGNGEFWQYPRQSVIRLDRARELDASGPEPVAFCQPDNPDAKSAFSWPGTARNPAHMQPLYATPRAAEAGEWLPIETAPKDGTPILAFCPSEREWPILVIHWALSYWYVHGDDGYGGSTINLEPTHWMPLPPIPKAPQG